MKSFHSFVSPQKKCIIQLAGASSFFSSACGGGLTELSSLETDYCKPAAEGGRGSSFFVSSFFYSSVGGTPVAG